MDIRFGEGDWERIERDYAAWWAHELDRPLVQVTGRDPGATFPELPSFHSNLPANMSAHEAIELFSLVLEATHWYGDAFPRWWPNFGPGIAAGFLGARVRSVDETVWFEPMDRVPTRELSLKDQEGNPWWQRIEALTRAAVETWGRRVQVGHTDLGGNLDIVASFRTTEGLLLDLYDAPEEVERLVGEVTRHWLEYYQRLLRVVREGCRGTTCWAPIWTPGTTYMLQCDFSYMISPEMFARFVLPDLTACCDYLDCGFYHLDGSSQIPHLDMLLAIPRLRGIQWVPGDGAPPPEEWLPLLKRIIDGGKLCQLSVSAEGALEIVRNLGGKGFMLSVRDQMDEQEAQAFLAQVARENESG